MKDGFGNIVTTDSSGSVDAIDRFSNSLLGGGTDFAAVFQASDEDPDCALLAALAGQLGLFMETPDRLSVADHYLKRAEQAVRGATDREQILVKAICARRKQDFQTALACHCQLAESHPQDLLSVKIGQELYFNLGEDDGMLWLIDSVIEAHQSTAYAHGMRAFALEQKSLLAEAEEEGRRATEMQRCEPWAHHAVAHVMLTEGRLDDGIKWMGDLQSEWEECNSFMYTHNWWHLALFYLEKEEFEQALLLYDRHIWARDKSFSQDQINAISLLWRLELAGAPVGDRWQDVAEHVSKRSFVNDEPFLDMQYAFALARGHKRNALDDLIAGMRETGASGPDMTQETWRQIAVPATEAFVACADAEYHRAIDLLEPVRAHMQKTGGSHAQRDLFEQVWIDCLIQIQDFDRALPLIQARLDFRKPVTLDQTLFARTLKAQSTGLDLR